MAETFPFIHPSEARRLFTSEAVARRLALTAHWSNTAKILELYGSMAGISLAKDPGCEVTLAEADEAALKALELKVAAAGVSARAKVAQWSPGALPVADGSQDGVLVLGRLWASLDDAAVKLRRALAPKGRLVVTWPVRVGLRPLKSAVELWEQRLGTKLKSPRECLMDIEKHGYEPETLETPSEAEVDEYYQSVGASVAKLGSGEATGLKQELELHRETGGKNGVTLAILVARRKEPGERPPASRDGG